MSSRTEDIGSSSFGKVTSVQRRWIISELNLAMAMKRNKKMGGRESSKKVEDAMRSNPKVKAGREGRTKEDEG